MNRNIFCTLFDSNYIDKGLVLFDSMKKNIGDFKLYVVAFDDKTYDILSAEADDRLIPISLADFETPQLLAVKADRTRAEYCWTCSSWSIKYVLEHYKEPICTYIDADMRFFASPASEFEKMHKEGKSVIIVPHRFATEKERLHAHNTVGEYCVEFNTFVNDEEGRKVLDWWADKCLEWCYYAVPGTTEWYGDQKYLNEFINLSPKVMVCNHSGIGLAPWNGNLVELKSAVGDDIRIADKQADKEYPLVLYHFESVSFLSPTKIMTPSKIKEKDLYHAIYDVYISEILEKRKYLEERYNHKLEAKRRIVTSNPIMKIYQKYLSPLRRIRKSTDLYYIK